MYPKKIATVKNKRRSNIDSGWGELLAAAREADSNDPRLPLSFRVQGPISVSYMAISSLSIIHLTSF